MSNRKSKLPPVKSPSLIMRFVAASGSPGIAVVATETPVERFDDARGCVVKEVLLMDGCVFRGGRNQIPIVDSHDDSTVRNIFGSVQNLQINRTTGELFGTPSFASDGESQVIAGRLNEGHITDFSITAIPIEGIFIQRGQSYTTPRGEVIDGPAQIYTSWTPHNASICATGADVNSHVRRSYSDLRRKVSRMDEALMAQLSSLGLPEGMTDPNQALLWMAGKLSAGKSPEVSPVENMEKPVEPVATPVAEVKPVENMGDVKEEVARALKGATERRKTIQADCKLQRLERAFADELCDSDFDINEARVRILRKVATRELETTPSGDRVEVTGSSDDKFYNAVRDGLIMRSARNTGIKKLFAEGEKPAEGHKDFEQLGFKRIAEQFLIRRGVNTSRMNDPDIAKLAMGNRELMRRHRIERDAYHTTGSFSNLLLDAASKTLLAAYEEAPYTWNLWARQASSVPDFKAINRIRFSEAPNLEIVPERHEYPEKTMSDSRESYSPDKYGAMFSVSWETVINDDMDAISRIPAMHGNAARRQQNRAVYSVLTANANMGDTGALFNTTAVTTAGGHANNSGAPAVISATTLNTAYASMMRQTGLNSSVILNIQPSFLIVPASISHTALQFVNSIADPGAGGSAAGNSNTLNIYGPQGMRTLKVIIEPQLDANSASVWYLAADYSQVDTVELAFLQGEESPVLESDWDMTKDVYIYKIRQTFGVKAIDYRGLYRNS